MYPMIFGRRSKKLKPSQQGSIKAAWRIFKGNPFDQRLRVHKIHRLSAAYGKTVHAVVVEADLRVIFVVEEETVLTLDVGTHEIYRSVKQLPGSERNWSQPGLFCDVLFQRARRQPSEAHSFCPRFLSRKGQIKY